MVKLVIQLKKIYIGEFKWYRNKEFEQINSIASGQNVASTLNWRQIFDLSSISTNDDMNCLDDKIETQLN